MLERRGIERVDLLAVSPAIRPPTHLTLSVKSTSTLTVLRAQNMIPGVFAKIELRFEAATTSIELGPGRLELLRVLIIDVITTWLEGISEL